MMPAAGRMHPDDPDERARTTKPVLSDSQGRVVVGHIYEVTIIDEIERPVIGANGVCQLGGADMRIAGARKGERYRVRVLAVGINQWTGRLEATVQKLDGPL